MVNNKVNHTKEINDLHEQAGRNKVKRIGYETKIIDL